MGWLYCCQWRIQWGVQGLRPLRLMEVTTEVWPGVGPFCYGQITWEDDLTHGMGYQISWEDGWTVRRAYWNRPLGCPASGFTACNRLGLMYTFSYLLTRRVVINSRTNNLRLTTSLSLSTSVWILSLHMVSFHVSGISFLTFSCRSVVSSGYSGFLHQKTDFIIIISPPWYDPGCSWGVKPQ